MKILVLTSAVRQPDNHLLWDGLKRFCEVEVHYLSKEQQGSLRKYLSAIQVDAFDWIVLDLFFKMISRQARWLRRLPKLVIYEEDACQEFIPSSRWRGKFSDFYKKIHHARVIMTGHQVAEKFRELGVDVRFLPKGYDSSRLFDMNRQRSVRLGFIGRLASDAYRERSEFLGKAVEAFGLRVMRTEPGEAYCAGLNSIQVFVSADIGLGEYMAKNFEAMACGCLLLAYRQGGGEEAALHFEDGVNVLLYSDFQEFSEKVAWLDQNPGNLQAIAAKGKVLAESHFNYFNQSQQLHAFLSDEPRQWQRPFLDRILGRNAR
jgi:glycosyltransferase involved in cell wall biosynthesis